MLCGCALAYENSAFTRFHVSFHLIFYRKCFMFLIHYVIQIYIFGKIQQTKKKYPPSKIKQLDLMAGVKKRGTWKFFSKFNVFPHTSEHLLLLTLLCCRQPVKI